MSDTQCIAGLTALIIILVFAGVFQQGRINELKKNIDFWHKKYCEIRDRMFEANKHE